MRHNFRLASEAGVQFVTIAGPDQLQDAVERTCREANAPCYLIPAGGSSPLGNLGYTAAALELHRQITAGQLPQPDAIFLPLGSGGTMAGLVFGGSLLASFSQIIGVRVAPEEVVNAALVRQQIVGIRSLLRRSGAERNLSSLHLPTTIVDNQYGGQYGKPTTAALRASERAWDAGRDRP